MNNSKLFYLHIPKTAGTTLNKFLEELYGEENCEFHIESHKDLLNFNDSYSLQNKKILSGHITLPRANKLITNFSQYKIFTLFRDPYEHISSHLRYVRRLGDPSESSRLKMHTAQIQKIVAKILSVDLSNASDIIKFITWMEEEKISLFNNTQMQYLVQNRFDFSKKMFIKAQDALSKIDIVGISERTDEFKFMIANKLNKNFNLKPEILNKNTIQYGLDFNKISIRNAIEPLIKYDAILYQIARKRFIKDMHNLLSQIEIQSNSPYYSTINLNVLNKRNR